MHCATLSSKYQMSIPKAIREALALRPGQKFSVIAKGSVIELVPLRSLESARGMPKGADKRDYRDHADRV